MLDQSTSSTSMPTFQSLKLNSTGGLTVGSSTPSATQWGYLSSLDQSVATTSTPRLTKLGIGQAAGTQPLEVTGNMKCTNNVMAAGANLIGLGATSLGSLVRLHNNYLYTDNSFDQTVATTSTPQFTKLGIGQAAGTNALEVTGNVKIANGSALKLNHTDGTAYTTSLDLKNSAGYGFYVETGSVTLHGDNLTFRAKDFNSGSGDILRYVLSMSPTGQVGIGQFYGTDSLEVYGNIKINSGSLKLVGTNIMTITPATLTAARTLTLPDANLILTPYSGPDQSVSTTASPSFAGMSVQTSSSLPSYSQGTLYLTGSASTATPQRMLIGDGTGWNMCMSTRNNSVTSDLYTFADSGVLTIASPQGLKVGNNFPTQAQWSYMCADNQYVDTTATPQFTNITATTELRLKNTWRMGSTGTNCMNFANWAADNFPLQLYLNGTTLTEWRCTNSALGVKMTNGSALTSFTINSANVYLPNITAGAGTYPVKWTSGGGLTYETSSLRFKENIKEYSADEGLIYDMKPVKFNYKNDEKKIERIGLIAETLAEVDKDEKYVIRGQDGLPEGIAYDRMIVPLIACIQDLKKRIEVLEAKLR